MSFLFPLFLLGALAVAIPIALHLSRRDLSPRVAFSDIRFLTGAPVMQSRWRRLQELLLLVLRVAALVLLAVAFARPFVDATGVLGRAVTLVALDTSFSMMSPRDGYSTARDVARDVVTRAPDGDLVGVVTFDDRPRLAVEPSRDRNQALAAVDSAAPGYGGTSYAEVLRFASSIMGSRHGRLVVVTDLQRSGWGIEAEAVLPRNVEIELRDVDTTTENLAVVGFGQRPAGLSVIVTNVGPSERTTTIRVHVDGAIVSTTEATVSRGVTDVPLDLQLPDEGVLRVEIDDPEGVEADDRRYLLLDAPSRTPVVVVVDDDGQRHDGFYLRHALSVGNPGREFEVRTLHPSALTDADISPTAAIVLMGAAGLDRAARQMLRMAVRGGAGLWLLGGPTVEPELVVDLLDLDLRLTPLDADGARRGWAVLDPRHPIFQVFEDVAAFGQIRFHQTLQMDAAGGRVLARFSDGNPALVEHVVGDGHVLVFGSDLAGEWNDLPRHPIFVPLVHEVLHYLGGNAARRADLLVAEAPEGLAPSPGVYDIPETSRRVVLNVDPRESDLTRVSSEDFLGRVGVEPAMVAEHTAAEDLADREAGQGYWWYVMALMLGVLAVETWLARTVA